MIVMYCCLFRITT